MMDLIRWIFALLATILTYLHVVVLFCLVVILPAYVWYRDALAWREAYPDPQRRKAMQQAMWRIGGHTAPPPPTLRASHARSRPDVHGEATPPSPTLEAELKQYRSERKHRAR